MASLNEGATSFAGANWSDATGFADNATLEVNKRFGPITGSTLDWTSLSATGIDSLDFNEGAVGRVGGGGESLQVDANNTGTERVRNRGAVELYLTDGGTRIVNLDLGGFQRTTLTGGTYTTVTIDGGLLTAQASAVIETIRAMLNPVTKSQGGGTIEYNATGMTLGVFTAGNWTIKRGFTKIIVAGSARVTLHAESGTQTEVEQHGGRLIPMYGDLVTYEGTGGKVDFSQAQEAIDWGSTTCNFYGAEIVGTSSLVDLTNIAYAGASAVRQGSIPA